MNLVSIGPVVSEEKMFENVDLHTHTHTHGRQRPTYTILEQISNATVFNFKYFSSNISYQAYFSYVSV